MDDGHSFRAENQNWKCSLFGPPTIWVSHYKGVPLSHCPPDGRSYNGETESRGFIHDLSFNPQPPSTRTLSTEINRLSPRHQLWRNNNIILVMNNTWWRNLWSFIQKLVDILFKHLKHLQALVHCSLSFRDVDGDGDYLFAGRRKHYNFVGAIGHKPGVFFSSPFLNCLFLFRWTWPSQVATSTPTSSSRWSPSWSTPGRARSS